MIATHLGLMAAGPVLSRLACAGVSRDSVICVTGFGALQAMLWLSRHGFGKVGCLRPGVGFAGEAPDALIIPRTSDPTQIAAAAPLARRVSRDGVVICQINPGREIAQAVDALLRAAGFHQLEHLSGRRRDLVVARRGLSTAEAA